VADAIRDRDTALLRFGADYVVWDTLGVYAFYDGDAVVPNPGGVAFYSFRNDSGI
jgi:hypothetical protein